MNAVDELQQIQNSGIRFSLHGYDEERFIVRLDNYRDDPTAQVVVRTLEEAVSWLREQVKARYPESAYAKRLLTN